MSHSNLPHTTSTKLAPKDKDPLSRFIAWSHKWVVGYFHYILVLIVLALVVFGIVLFWNYWTQRQNQKAEDALYNVKQALIEVEKKEGGNVLSFDKQGKGFFKPAQKAKTYTSEMKDKAQQYVSAILKYKHVPAGAVASVEMAYFLNTYDQPDQALKLLQTVSKHFKQKTIVGFLLAFQTGVVLMDQGHYTQALEKFQWIEVCEQAKYLHADALLKMGLIYEATKQIAKAKSTYHRIKTNFAQSGASKRALQYLNLLQVKLALESKTPKPIQKKDIR